MFHKSPEESSRDLRKLEKMERVRKSRELRRLRMLLLVKDLTYNVHPGPHCPPNPVVTVPEQTFGGASTGLLQVNAFLLHHDESTRKFVEFIWNC